MNCNGNPIKLFFFTDYLNRFFIAIETKFFIFSILTFTKLISMLFPPRNESLNLILDDGNLHILGEKKLDLFQIIQSFSQFILLDSL